MFQVLEQSDEEYNLPIGKPSMCMDWMGLGHWNFGLQA